MTAKKAVWRFVGITWTLGVFILQQLFAGEMFTAMTLPPALDVIDSYSDLAAKTSAPISLFHLEEASADNYFWDDMEQRTKDKLTKRLQVIPVERIFNSDVIKGILVNVSSGRQYHLGADNRLEQYRNDFFGGKFKESTYISKEFGQTLPVFLILNKCAETRIKDAFNSLMTTMQEGGIYDQWVASCSSKRIVEKKVIVRFEPAQLKHFGGLVAICVIFMSVASFFLLLEIVNVFLQT